MIIDGKKIAEEVLAELKELPKPDKFLSAVLVGEDAASVSFLKQKEKVAKELGVNLRLYKFPADATQDALRGEVLKIAEHKTCGGVLVQLPLPAGINAQYVLNAIPREKDVDVLGERALGAFYAGRNPVLPPAVGVIQRILTTYDLQLTTLKAVVIGRGALVGKPIAMWLMGKVVELTVFNSTTQNLRGKLKDADLIVSGVGKAGLFGAADVKENALVIDFGYDKKQMADGKERMAGDFDSSDIGNWKLKIENLSYTPTPGGTGPILVAQLFENFYALNAK
ncbi:MAG: bifunctional 5,10-methylenetetrahydrofolate dehydrogenase/5,10-methenyltetrahydrofolate cyclohydrolase [Candidatus Jorgensenbacteria bacterium]